MAPSSPEEITTEVDWLTGAIGGGQASSVVDAGTRTRLEAEIGIEFQDCCHKGLGLIYPTRRGASFVGTNCRGKTNIYSDMSSAEALNKLRQQLLMFADQ